MKKHLSLLLLFLLVLVSNCNTTEPPIDNSNTKKEYRWTETKLIQPQGKGVVPTAIWGSDTNDVWAVGWNDSHQGEIFHYDGTEWKNVTPFIPLNDEYMDVFGFGKNDVYVVGDSYWLQPNNILLSSLILHYDGSTWSVVLNDSTGQGYLHKIHGNSKNNVWAVGGNGAIYHYNGSNWQRKPFPDSLDCHSVFGMPNNQVYMTYEYNDRQINGLLIEHFGEYVNDIIYTIDTCRITIQNGEMVGYKFGYKTLWGVSNEKLLSACPNIYRYNGTSWTWEMWDQYQFNDVKGSSWNNIYAVGDHGTLHWYNGSKWSWISKYASTIVDFKAVMPFEKVIYILGYYRGDAWIIKGEVTN